MTAVGADPGVYEAWLGEATELMLDQAGVGPGSRVLDVAAGAGRQTLMVSNIYATVADPERLDFDPGAFDAAICRLGLMFLSDVTAALRGIHVALRPGGRFSAIVYGEPEHNALLAALGPEVFSLSAPGALEAALHAAGFSDVEVEQVDATLPSTADFEGGPCRLLVAGGRRS